MTLKEMQERRAAIYATEIDAAKTDAELDVLQTELRKLDMQIAEEEKRAAAQTDPVGRTAAVTTPDVVISNVMQQTRKSEDAEEMEYRKAFMQYVTRGTAIPVELRAGDENTLTTDIGSAIPTVLVNQIIEKMETFGVILPLVTRTNYAAGVAIPTATVKPTATWVSEGASSDRQKKTTGTITFSRFKLRCEISMSMESSVLAIAAFEAAFVRQVSEAMVKAIEAAIISTNNGSSTPKGIIAETPETGQALTANELTYELLCDIEAAIPTAYEAGAVHVMTKKTFMAYVAMTDAEGQPVAHTNYGVGGRPERTLLGRPVIIIEGNATLKSFATTLTAGDLFHFVFNFADYVLNTVYDMGVQRKQDWDTEDMLAKAVMSVDGKVVDKNSLVTVKKLS